MRDALRMGWFRRHIRTGSRLALLALAVQFVLAFGHVHSAHAQATHQASPSYSALIAAAIEAEAGIVPTLQPASDDRGQIPHHPPVDECAICAVVAAAAHALFASSPILHVPQAIVLLQRVTDAGFAHLDPAHAPFQPRGPPTS